MIVEINCLSLTSLRRSRELYDDNQSDRGLQKRDTKTNLVGPVPLQELFGTAVGRGGGGTSGIFSFSSFPGSFFSS